MKILHVIDSQGLYGAERVILSLMLEQGAMGLETHLCSIGNRNAGEKAIETEASRRGLRVRKMRMRDGPNIAGGLAITRFARREGFDLLHSHGYKSNILLGFIPKRLRGIPLVSTIHGWTSTQRFSKIGLYD